MNTISIASFNCKGIHSAEHEIYELCSGHDIVCLQETWLDKSELSIFNNFHPEFNWIGVSPVDPSEGLIRGRKYGGVGFLWKKKYQASVNPLKLEHNWLTGISVTLNNCTMYILGVYLPYDSFDNIDPFLNCLHIAKSNWRTSLWILFSSWRF